MKFSSGICLSFILTASVLAVDLPFKKKPQDFQTRKPNEVADTLRNGTPQQRNDLAVELSMLLPPQADKAVRSNSPCVDFTHIEESQVTLRAGAENEVLLAESQPCDAVYIVVFDKAPKSEWRHVQTVRLPSRTQRSAISFSELIEPKVSEILIRHETTLDTGAASQQNFVVLKMLHDRMEVVFDATEQSTITLANRDPAESDNLTQTQKSTFDLPKSAPNAAASYRILEQQVITDNKTVITRSIVWTWDPAVERFRPAPFDGGNARPVPPPAKKPTAAPPSGSPPK